MNTPPAHLLQRLRERMDELPAAQRSVVQCVLEDPRAAVAATVEQLAQQAGVSMPTIVRTCRSFGFESVREFMLALAQDLAVTGSYLHRSVLAEDSAGDVTSKIIHAAVSSLTELGRRIDVDVIDRGRDPAGRARGASTATRWARPPPSWRANCRAGCSGWAARPTPSSMRTSSWSRPARWDPTAWPSSSRTWGACPTRWRRRASPARRAPLWWR